MRGAEMELALPCRIAELIDTARRRTPVQLDDATWRRLEGIADPLPAVASEAAFEVRLGDARGAVDLELCVRPEGGGRERAVAALESPAFVAAAARSDGWRRAGAFLRRWADPSSCLHPGVAVVWLEFDVAEDGRAEPFLVFTLRTDAVYPDGLVDRARLEAVLWEGLRVLGDGLSREVRSQVSGFLDALPRTAEVRHVAVRPTPDGEIVRLVVRTPWRSLRETLDRARWPGDLRELGALLRALDPPDYALGLNFDVDRNGLGPRIGIEFCYTAAPANCERWARVFTALEEMGACTPGDTRALSTWGPDPNAACGPAIRVRRELLLKLVHRPGERPVAKAYLLFGPRLCMPLPTHAAAAARAV